MKIINQSKNYIYITRRLINIRSAFTKISIFFIFLSITLLVALIPNAVSNKNSIELKRPARFTTDIKYILFRTQLKKKKKGFFNKDIEYIPGQTEFIKQNCPYINCFLTYNRSLLTTEDDFDAIVFNVQDIKKFNTTTAYNINLGRSPQQIYIFRALEAAGHHPLCNPMMDDFFNWTWTYKLNSDLPQPLISVYDNFNNEIGPKTSMNWINMTHVTDEYQTKISGKTKAVAWFVTNCKLKNKYKAFVEKLREELKIYNRNLDVLGPCGVKKCNRGRLPNCLKTIEDDYFFNLVTEDAIAEDFVSQKMVRAMTYISVPIVYGGANYSKFLPPGSYVNAREVGLKKLGSVVDHLIKNLYSKYIHFFDWKHYYYYKIRPSNSICDLCTKLNENREKKSYAELRRWWDRDFDEVCQSDLFYELFNKI